MATKKKNEPPKPQEIRQLNVYLTPEEHKQLKLLAVEMEISQKDLIKAAVNDFLQKNKVTLKTG